MIKVKPDEKSDVKLRRSGLGKPARGALSERRLALTLRDLALPPTKDRGRIVLTQETET